MPEDLAAIADAWGPNVADAVALVCAARMALMSLALAPDLNARLRRFEGGGVDSSVISGSP
jgi:hypothetical protein